ncbi:aminoglycoside phosphotransferase family protein [Legionella oakridgensis]|uniref:Putative phosphotransferase related to Ser/Thr protein kinase n=2 Tax=Legionella oakridgensis TaxID=29423 RepID=W0BC03_9GAMM|nr:phosphotransferase [Legionella oakridgensis]AHE65949.1 putative phosphotransferase related to Ser/Thr protein kinase [Legionella oakridgensis ATCC 33761 = DSM 21215]ETO94320.1 putative phosphotransferase [Legionella oakridgensis RV-2-2007]KTD43799.1 putative phosphotransferase [Legionella oakridgensis]STY15877.1 putative phosphotransferase [Legionella longbeachae]
MHTRQSALNQWLNELFKGMQFTLIPLAGDASFRRYFRLQCQQQTYIVMDAPPDKETIQPFITIGKALANIGLHTPAISAVHHTQGFVLLEDFGDQLFLNALSNHKEDTLYEAAMTTLIQMQSCSINNLHLLDFNQTHMLEEMSLFRQWFLEAYLGLTLDANDVRLIQNTFNRLAEMIVEQPQVFIHRDYHSRNLMIMEGKPSIELGIIDYQDAMRGPFTYDLVSLLKDCYIQWPHEIIDTWISYFYHHLPTTHGWSLSEFSQAFAMCGLQRHLKVLGIFSRLHLRDQKSGYLRDLPRVFNYVISCVANYQELLPFYHFMQQKVQAPFLEMHSLCTLQ